MSLHKPKIPSRQSAWLVTAFVLVFVNAFALYGIFHELPSFLVRYYLNDTLAAMAYSLTFALIEGLLTSLAIIGVNALLPFWQDDDQFVLRGLWLSGLLFIYPFTLTGDMQKFWLFAGGLLVLGLLLIFVKQVRGIVYELAERIGILGWLLIALDIISVILVIIRLVVR